MFNKELPDDIIEDIFSSLPAKSIGRCRCVSKQWRHLLSQPDFIETHLFANQDGFQQGLILKSYSPSSLYSASLSNAHHLLDEITVSASRLPFVDIPNDLRVVSSCCHGLLLFADGEDKLFVVNPTTREIRIVPPWPSGVEFDYGECVKYGFGYDSVTDDYKIVVHISEETHRYEYDADENSGSEETHSYEYDADENSDSEPDETYVHESILYVYSLRNGTWKTTSNCPHFEVDDEEGVFLDGHIYWLGVWRYYKTAVMDFDLESEVFRCLPHYSKYHYIPECRLSVIGAHLWIIGDENNYWVTDGDTDEEPWTWIKLPHFGGSGVIPLCLSGEKELVFLVSPGLVIFNEKEQIPKEIVVHGIEGDYQARTANTYTETLVSPNNITATGRG